MGKGRQIAGMIKEEHARGGTRTLWLSVSNDLRFDAERDLADVGADHIPVFPQVLLLFLPDDSLLLHTLALSRQFFGPWTLSHAWQLVSPATVLLCSASVG